MTIRFDEKLCDIVITDDNGSATQLNVPFNGIAATVEPSTVASKRPSEPRYVVSYMGHPLFRSNRIMGDRVKAMLARGMQSKYIMVYDTVGRRYYGITNA